MKPAGHMCWQWRLRTRFPWPGASITLTCPPPLSPSEWWMKTRVPTLSPTPNSLNWKREWCPSQHWPSSPRRTLIASCGRKSRMLLEFHWFVSDLNVSGKYMAKKGLNCHLLLKDICPNNTMQQFLSPSAHLPLQLCGHESMYQSANSPCEIS